MQSLSSWLQLWGVEQLQRLVTWLQHHVTSRCSGLTLKWAKTSFTRQTLPLQPNYWPVAAPPASENRSMTASAASTPPGSPQVRRASLLLSDGESRAEFVTEWRSSDSTGTEKMMDEQQGIQQGLGYKWKKLGPRENTLVFKALPQEMGVSRFTFSILILVMIT